MKLNTNMTLRLDPDVRARLDRMAEASHMTTSQLIRRLIDEGLARMPGRTVPLTPGKRES